MNDSELLQAWANRRDEAAFAELVRRHLDLVRASARRQVGASPLAEDVTQAVFLVLARKAGSLGDKVVLSGWLFRTTRFVAARALRAEQRRTHHETVAAMQPAVTDAPAVPEHWQEVEPHLDAGLAALPAADRDAVLLRYFEGKPIRSVGELLGVNEEAAKKRVSRAVEKLRTWLAGRGVVLTAAGLVTLLGNLPVGAAPAELAGQIAAAATANTAGATAATLAAGALRDWWLAQLRQWLPWAAAALLLVTAGISSLLPRSETTASGEVATVTPGDPRPTTAPVAMASAPPAGPAAGLTTSRLLLNVRSIAGNRPLAAQLKAMFWGRTGDSTTLDLATDADGNAEIPITDPPQGSLTLWISAPDHVPVVVEWRRHEFTEPVLAYQCLLEPGQELVGVVQDEAGRPVADARIEFVGPGLTGGKRQNIGFHSRLSSTSSDATGRFRTGQLPSLRGHNGHMTYAVIHPEFIRQEIVLEGSVTAATHQTVVLRRGLKVAGQVLGADGAPVPDAIVEHIGRNGHSAQEARTGEDGRFLLGSFSPGTVELVVSAPGFLTAREKVPAGTETLLFRLQPDDPGSNPPPGSALADTVRLRGTVVDAESGEPLPRFSVLSHSGGPERRLLRDGHAGRFDWAVEGGFREPFTVEVDADGYETAVSDLRNVPAEEHAFAFRLRRGEPGSGRVVDAAGRPVADAVVGLNGLGFGFIIRDDRTFSGNNAPQTITDAAGQFSIRLKPNTESLVVVHEVGFALVPVAQAKRAMILLQPWGAIEGTVLTAGQPAAGQQVFLHAWLPDSDAQLWPVALDTTVTSDARGRFRFNHVPPGPVALSRYYKFSPGTAGNAGIGPRQRVDVLAGGVVEVMLATTGRTLVGRFEMAQPVAGHQWRDDIQTLEEIRSDLPTVREVFRNHPEFPKYLRVERRREAQIRKFFPDIQPDGSFRMDDVPAGTYRLTLCVSVPPTDYSDENQRFFRRELGKLEVPVVVPPGDFNDPPLDLGTITIPVKQR